jgi:nondiscriminating aspartyl-tRNA synthetase
MIEAATGQQVVGEPDLAPAHERWLGEWARTKHSSEFLFVEGYPMARRPFYTHPQLDRPEYYLAVLEPGAQEALTGYLDAFRYAMPPHGGFAIGLERWTARLVGAANIRQVTTFPRDLKRLAP